MHLDLDIYLHTRYMVVHVHNRSSLHFPDALCSECDHLAWFHNTSCVGQLTWIQIVIAVNIGHVVTAPTLQ